MTAKTILIIEDDIQICNLEQEVLEREGYTCIRAYSGTEAVLLLEKNHPDLIILDLMLPGLSGEQLLAKISSIPVIVISAKDSIDDKVSVLLDGAQDYMTKPFCTKELLARVHVQLRRKNEKLTGKIVCNEIVIDDISHGVTVNGNPVNLTRTEYAILKLLAINQGEVIARSVLLDHISNDTPDCTESSLKTHISHIRAKLRQHSDKEYIQSVWGIGFRFVSE